MSKDKATAIPRGSPKSARGDVQPAQDGMGPGQQGSEYNPQHKHRVQEQNEDRQG